MNRIKKITIIGLLAVLLLAGCTDDHAANGPAAAATYQADAPSEAIAAEEGLLTVTFLDVGQGNAVLVENNGAYMLVDGGDRDYSSFVVSYLEKQGVTELEYVVSSHYDADHLNGIVGALHVYPCETFLGADYVTDTKIYQSLCAVLDEKDISVAHPRPGDNYALGDAEFTIVCPNAYGALDDNDNSIGIRLEYGDTSFLICGDASADVEWEMIQSGLTLESDVYLASHHGSRYSSSQEFLEAVNPKAVVISAGLDNSYGHPTQEVMDRIAQTGAQLYRTDLQGTVIVTSDGKKLAWNQEPSGDFRSGEEVSGKVSGKSGDYVSDQNTDTSGKQSAAEQTGDYVMNLNTRKFHLPTCSSVDEMKEKNKAEFSGTRQELIDSGYAPCKRCNP